MPVWPQTFTSTVSHWQATNRGPTSLWNHGREDTLPTEVLDYLIIGAGVTGASMAYQLTRPGSAGDGKRIALIEAKDVASGASGRNGGHIGPDTWALFLRMTTPLEQGGAGLTPEEALDIFYFEHDNLDLVEEIVKKEGLDVDFWRGDRYDVIRSEERAKQNLANFQTFQKVKKGSKHEHKDNRGDIIADAAEAEKLSRVRGTLQVNKVRAGSWHPHRGVTALVRLALESKAPKSFNLYSWCPVNDLPEQPVDGVWTVDCGARGRIRAKQVIIATNAWTRHLFPTSRIFEHLTPYRGHAGLITSPPAYSGANSLNTTYGIENGPYLIQTPYSGLVIGPYNDTVMKQLGGAKHLYYIEDDSVVEPKFAEWIGAYCKKDFIGWGDEAKGEGASRIWSGLMCESVDLRPLVGPVPGRPGLWLSAGYNGHGMAKIISITRSMARHMKTGEWDPYMPKAFAITEKRLRDAERIPVLYKEAAMAKL